MLERLLPLLDVVVLEQNAAGLLEKLLPFPSWFLEYCTDAKASKETLKLDSPFLSDFLGRATEFWNAGVDGLLDSGPWNETSVNGRDWMLHATAVLLSGRRILLLEPAKVPLEETQVLLQKGRQKSLDFRTVKTKQRSLRKVQQRYLALLDAVPDWVLVVHKDGSLLEYSTGRDELFEDMQLEVGRAIADVLPADLAAQILPQLENVISSGRPQMWKYKNAAQSIEILMLATGEDEAMCILRPKSK